MINAPYLPTAAELSQNINTPFYIHTDLSVYYMPGYKVSEKVALGEWTDYRMVIIPGETKTEIRHYLNGIHADTTHTNKDSMSDLFNPDSLYKLSFAWRSTGNDETVATEGYMDFDDVKVYELKDYKFDVTFTNADGKEIDKLADAKGKVNVNASLINNGIGRTLDVYAAVYTKQGSGWKLTDIKAIKGTEDRHYLYTFAWRKDVGTLSLDVTDAENQMIKLFVWKKTEDLDGDQVNLEKLPEMQSVCETYILN